jgi:tetratricopeptide (TPR) repeat protein
MITNANSSGLPARALRGSRRRCVLFAVLLTVALLPGIARSQEPSDAATYDPFHAQKAVEIGLYYLRKGDLDAAIDRFQDAIHYRANFARPRLLLAQTCEKKGDKEEALRYYQEYLKVLPGAPDAKKVQAKIAKLSRATEQKPAVQNNFLSKIP